MLAIVLYGWITSAKGMASSIYTPVPAVRSTCYQHEIIAINSIRFGMTPSKEGFVEPMGIAADAYGNVWVANSGGDSVTRFKNAWDYGIRNSSNISNPSGRTLFLEPAGIAVDKGGNVWVTNVGNNSVTELRRSSHFSTGSARTFSGGGDGLSGTLGYYRR